MNIALLVLLLLIQATSACDCDIFVIADGGNDSADGRTRSAAVESLDRARSIARSLKQRAGSSCGTPTCVARVRMSGSFALQSTFVLDSAEYEFLGDGACSLSGGVAVGAWTRSPTWSVVNGGKTVRMHAAALPNGNFANVRSLHTANASVLLVRARASDGYVDTDRIVNWRYVDQGHMLIISLTS